jgi:predicted nuclease of predicted toxin-antitoxin system
MILPDENIFDIIIEALQKEGYEVLSIKNTSLLRGISDIDIASFSLQPPRIIITEDTDFGNLIFERRIQVTGVIF